MSAGLVSTVRGLTPVVLGSVGHFADATPFMRRLQRAELAYVTGSEAGGRVVAENYVGLPFGD